jgi:hypothetical protein
VFFVGQFFFFFEKVQPHGQFVPVHLVSVELRAVDAREFRFPADRDAAGAAHTGAIYHYGVERDQGPDLRFPGDACHCFHHRDRADGVDQIDVHLFRQQVRQDIRNEPFLPGRPVVGDNEKLVRCRGHLIDQDKQVPVPCADNADHLVARRPESLDDRQHFRRAYPAGDSYYRSRFFYRCGMAQRPHHVGQCLAFVQLAQRARRLSRFLENDPYRAFFPVRAGDSQRDPFAALVNAQDDELPRFRLSGDLRSRDVHLFQVRG